MYWSGICNDKLSCHIRPSLTSSSNALIRTSDASRMNPSFGSTFLLSVADEPPAMGLRSSSEPPCFGNAIRPGGRAVLTASLEDVLSSGNRPITFKLGMLRRFGFGALRGGVSLFQRQITFIHRASQSFRVIITHLGGAEGKSCTD